MTDILQPRNFVVIAGRCWQVGETGIDCPLYRYWERYRLARLEHAYRAALATPDAHAAYIRLAAFQARIDARIAREAEGMQL